MTQTYSCRKEDVLKLDIGCLINNVPCLIFDATSTIEHNMITHTVHQNRFTREEIVRNRIHHGFQFLSSSLGKTFLVFSVFTLVITGPKNRNGIIRETCIGEALPFICYVAHVTRGLDVEAMNYK